MAEIINLRRARKRRARDDAEAAAQAARAVHGRTKVERLAQAQGQALRDRQLDNARLPDPARDGEPLE